MDNLSRVNLMLSSSGCGALKAYSSATFSALVRHLTAALEERVEANLAALNYPRCVLHEEEGVTLRHARTDGCSEVCVCEEHR